MITGSMNEIGMYDVHWVDNVARHATSRHREFKDGELGFNWMMRNECNLKERLGFFPSKALKATLSDLRRRFSAISEHG